MNAYNEKILSIVIPSYNVEKYLCTTLESILDCNKKEQIEILIVNDGSKDGTLFIAQDYENKYKSIVKVIDKENGGHGSAINAGVKVATGKFIKLLDGDDWVDARALDNIISELQKCSADLILSPFIKVFCDGDTIVTKEKVEISDLVDRKHYSINKILEIIDFFPMHGIIYKANVIKKSKLIRENCFYVDQEYVTFPICYVNDCVYVDEPLYQYRLGRTDQSMNISNMIKNREMHRKVIEDIVDYYYTASLDSSRKAYVYNRILRLSETQFEIYYSMGSWRQGRKETKNFIDYLKTKCYEVWENLSRKQERLIKKTSYAYFVIVIVNKAKCIIKKIK